VRIYTHSSNVPARDGYLIFRVDHYGNDTRQTSWVMLPWGLIGIDVDVEL